MRRVVDAATPRRALLALFDSLAGHDAIGLAVSGGADSLALMLLAREWAGALVLPPRLIVYSVDHGLRPEATAEAAYVVDTATRLGLMARALRWDGPKPDTGVQAAARQARYRLIGKAMREDGAQVLLTAHHRDDQAETVLMRLAHGSGLEGLRGMDASAEVEGVPVFRPLLAIDPPVLRAVVAEGRLVPVADPSNTDRHYERVRWRQALPQLAALGLDGAQLSQFARRAGDADSALDQWAARVAAELVDFDPLGAMRLPRAAVLGLPRAVGVKLLGRLLAIAGGNQRPRALGVVERLHDRLSSDLAFAATTILGASIRQRGESLWLSREAGRAATPPMTISPHESVLWDGRFVIGNRSPCDAISVRMGRELSRTAAERLIGRPLTVPAAAIRAAPVVSGPVGEVLALGGYRLDERVAIELLGTSPQLLPYV